MNEFERRMLTECVEESVLGEIYGKLTDYSGSRAVEYEKIAYIMIKPGFVSAETKALVEEKLVEKELKILSQSDIIYNEPTTDLHYLDLIQKGFYETELKPYFVSGPCYGYLVYGDNAIDKVREIACGKGGTTKNVKEDGLRYIIPKKLGQEMDITKNVIHATGSVADCRGEITCFVKNSTDYKMLQLFYAQTHNIPLEQVDANEIYKEFKLFKQAKLKNLKNKNDNSKSF